MLSVQEQLKGQVCRLNRDLENCEKRAQETKATLIQQAATLEAEYQQTIANLKKNHDVTVIKLTDEKVCC